MSKSEPSFQEFFGLSDEEEKAFIKATEIAASGEKIEKSEKNKEEED